VVRAARYRLIVARQRFARLSSEAVLGRLRDAVSRREQRLDELAFRRDAAWGQLERGRAARLTGLEMRLRRQDVSLRLVERRRKLDGLRARLERAAEMPLRGRRMRMERAAARLQGMSPLAVLGRGYALVYGADGRLLRRAEDARVGEEIEARLAEGRVRAKVTES
jgi:exodeoxyribonuclease VII large subunit